MRNRVLCRLKIINRILNSMGDGRNSLPRLNDNIVFSYYFTRGEHNTRRHITTPRGLSLNKTQPKRNKRLFTYMLDTSRTAQSVRIDAKYGI